MSNQWVKTTEKLEKDLTESYQKIIDKQKYPYPEYEDETQVCIFCSNGLDDHDSNCIVLKAEEWLEG